MCFKKLKKNHFYKMNLIGRKKILKEELECFKNSFKNTGRKCENTIKYTYKELNELKNLQTPINIKTSEIEENFTNISINYDSNVLGEIIINPNSRYFIPFGSKCFLLYDNIRYDLIQFHVHHKAENRVDNILYPLEFHFVHENSKKNILVLSLLVSISDIFSNLTKWTNGLFIGNSLMRRLDLSNLNSLTNKTCYMFDGALTTPPFTSNVKWLLFSHLDIEDLTISQEDYKDFKEQYPKNSISL